MPNCIDCDCDCDDADDQNDFEEPLCDHCLNERYVMDDGGVTAAFEKFSEDPFCTRASALIEQLTEDVYERVCERAGSYGAFLVLTDYLSKLAFEQMWVLYHMLPEDEREEEDFVTFALESARVVLCNMKNDAAQAKAASDKEDN